MSAYAYLFPSGGGHDSQRTVSGEMRSSSDDGGESSSYFFRTAEKEQQHQQAMEEAQKHQEKLLMYLLSSDFKVPPLPHDLSADGEPSHEHLYHHGGALKKGRISKRFPHRIDLHSLDLSFGGCGFLGMYHIGVAAAFKHFVPDCRFNRICGTSAGAIAAAAIIGEVPFTEVASHMINAAIHARQNLLGPWSPGYIITKTLTDSLERLLPSDIHEKANGRLFISVTRTNEKANNSVISSYVSKEDLIKVVIASTFIPVFSGSKPIRHRNQGCIDGGFSSNILHIFRNTITVSPFASSALICPVDHGKTRNWAIHRYYFADQGTDITVANLKRVHNVLNPPCPEYMGELLEAGFRDGHRFLRRYGIAKCSQCLTIRSQLSPLKASGASLQSRKPHKPMKCQDGVACDKYSERHIKLPEHLQLIVSKYVNHSKHLHKEYNSSLMVQVAKLAWFVTRYNPLVMLATFGLSSYFNATMFVTKKIIELLPYVNQISKEDMNTTELVETTLGTLLATFFKEDVEKVPAGLEYMQNARAAVRHVDVKLTQVGIFVEPNPGEPVTDDTVELNLSADHDEMVDEDEVLSFHFEERIECDESTPQDLESPSDALLLQSNTLLAASKSTCPSQCTSRVASRIVSRAASIRNSRQSSRVNSRSSSRRNSTSSVSSQNGNGSHNGASIALGRSSSTISGSSNQTSNETIDNIRRLTEERDVAMGYYFRDTEGQLVTLSVYDVSDTSATDIIGDDIIMGAATGIDDEEDRPDDGSEVVEGTEGGVMGDRVADPRRMRELLEQLPRERFVTLLSDDDEDDDDSDSMSAESVTDELASVELNSDASNWSHHAEGVP